MEHPECDFAGVVASGDLLAGLSAVEQQPGFQVGGLRISQILQLYLWGFARHLLHIALEHRIQLVILCYFTVSQSHESGSAVASPWENGYIESFNGKLRDELLNVEIFATLFEAQILIESRRKDYNQIRPHGAFGYRAPAPETILPG